MKAAKKSTQETPAEVIREMATPMAAIGNAAVFVVRGCNRETVRSRAPALASMLRLGVGYSARRVSLPIRNSVSGLRFFLYPLVTAYSFPLLTRRPYFPRRVWLDLYHERGIHERRSMDATESVRLQFFCHH